MPVNAERKAAQAAAAGARQGLAWRQVLPVLILVALVVAHLGSESQVAREAAGPAAAPSRSVSSTRELRLGAQHRADRAEAEAGEPAAPAAATATAEEQAAEGDREGWDYGEASRYEKRQGSKLEKQFKTIVKYDQVIFPQLHKRFKRWKDADGNAGEAAFAGRNVLCVGARLGAEVKAFKKLGAVAVGINFNPGYRNPHVVFGDAMDIMYPKDGFDFLYINVMDHIAEWPKFLDEVKRVLRPGGYFFNDLDQNPKDAWAVHDNRKERKKLEGLVKSKGFEELSRRKITNEKDPGKLFYVYRLGQGRDSL